MSRGHARRDMERREPQTCQSQSRYERLTRRREHDPSALEKLDGNELRQVKGVTIVITPSEQPPEPTQRGYWLRLRGRVGRSSRCKGQTERGLKDSEDSSARILQPT